MHPFFKHVTSVKNNATNVLSCLEMIFKVSDELNWEPLNPHLTYKYNKENKQLCKNMVAMSYSNSAVGGVSGEVNVIDVAKLISERYIDCKFVLDIHMFNYYQRKDKELQKK